MRPPKDCSGKTMAISALRASQVANKLFSSIYLCSGVCSTSAVRFLSRRLPGSPMSSPPASRRLRPIIQKEFVELFFYFLSLASWIRHASNECPPAPIIRKCKSCRFDSAPKQMSLQVKDEGPRFSCQFLAKEDDAAVGHHQGHTLTHRQLGCSFKHCR